MRIWEIYILIASDETGATFEIEDKENYVSYLQHKGSTLSPWPLKVRVETPELGALGKWVADAVCRFFGIEPDEKDSVVFFSMVGTGDVAES